MTEAKLGDNLCWWDEPSSYCICTKPEQQPRTEAEQILSNEFTKKPQVSEPVPVQGQSCDPIGGKTFIYKSFVSIDEKTDIYVQNTKLQIVLQWNTKKTTSQLNQTLTDQ